MITRLTLLLALPSVTIVQSLDHFDGAQAMSLSRRGKGWLRLTEENEKQVFSSHMRNPVALVISAGAVEWIEHLETYGNAFSFHVFIDDLIYGKQYLDRFVNSRHDECAVVWDRTSNMRWMMVPTHGENLTHSGLEVVDSHFKGYVDGFLKEELPHGSILTEPAPTGDDAMRQNVHVAVGSTFHDLVYGSPGIDAPFRPVLVCLFNTNCPTTRRWLPTFLQASEIVFSIKFVMMDSKLNHFVDRAAAGGKDKMIDTMTTSPTIMLVLPTEEIAPIIVKDRRKISNPTRLIEWVHAEIKHHSNVHAQRQQHDKSRRIQRQLLELSTQLEL